LHIPLKKGKIPAFVMATTGSTVLGSCDDLSAIADICEKHGVWMHVDVSNIKTENEVLFS
jgi:glutamate/tyrosine decarboxylase-like PLP-dependent enzyme